MNNKKNKKWTDTMSLTLSRVIVWVLAVIFAAAVVYVILLVLKVIAFFSICSGKAKEPAIIRNLGFLK